MNQIAITTDSACDMSKEMLNENQIEVLPLHVIFGTKEYADGVDVTSKDVLKFIDETGTLPKFFRSEIGRLRSGHLCEYFFWIVLYGTKRYDCGGGVRGKGHRHRFQTAIFGTGVVGVESLPFAG